MAVGRESDIIRLDRLLGTLVDSYGSIPVCLQPISQSPKATQLCIDTCLGRDWRLSVQVHKYLGLP